MRIFFAITLEDTAKKTLIDFIEKQKRNKALENMWWTKHDHLHITLRFIGHIEEDKLSELIQVIETQLEQQKTKSFIVNTKEIILFSTHHAKILSLEIEPNEALINIVELINSAAESIGFEREKRNFLPHLTLGRIKNNLLSPLPDLSLNPFQIPVNNIVLFKSKPTQEGSQYIQRHVFKSFV